MLRLLVLIVFVALELNFLPCPADVHTEQTDQRLNDEGDSALIAPAQTAKETDLQFHAESLGGTPYFGGYLYNEKTEKCEISRQ